jgi:hypothetical protein
MKKPLLLLMALFCAAQLLAQTPPVCKRDSSVLGDTSAIVRPLTYSTASPVYRLNEVCINADYLQYFTVEVPTTITISGITAGLVNASLATTGAVPNLPAGLKYACNPPNCVFNANTLGCIVVYGKATPVTTPLPDTINLTIKMAVVTNFLPTPFPIDFPGQVAPGQNYFMIRKPAGATCVTTSVPELTQIGSIKNTPNPFTGQTLIEVEALESGEFQLEVYDMMGRQMHAQAVRLQDGYNQIQFDAGALSAGTYIYSLHNATGRISRRMVVLSSN